MTTATEKQPKRTRRFSVRNIPPALIYEMWQGKPIYYKGYRDVLAGKKTIEEVISCSDLQGVLVSLLNGYLYCVINRKKYLGNDKAIFEKVRKALKKNTLTCHRRLLLRWISKRIRLNSIMEPMVTSCKKCESCSILVSIRCFESLRVCSACTSSIEMTQPGTWSTDWKIVTFWTGVA